jgi:hypothetical protein
MLLLKVLCTESLRVINSYNLYNFPSKCAVAKVSQIAIGLENSLAFIGFLNLHNSSVATQDAL